MAHSYLRVGVVFLRGENLSSLVSLPTYCMWVELCRARELIENCSVRRSVHWTKHSTAGSREEERERGRGREGEGERERGREGERERERGREGERERGREGERERERGREGDGERGREGERERERGREGDRAQLDLGNGIQCVVGIACELLHSKLLRCIANARIITGVGMGSKATAHLLHLLHACLWECELLTPPFPCHPPRQNRCLPIHPSHTVESHSAQSLFQTAVHC